MIGSFAFPGRGPQLVAALGLVGLFSLPAQATDYDGVWSFAMTCPAAGGQRAFTDRFQAPITDNVINRTRTNRNNEDVTRVTGRVENGAMNLVVERTRGTDRWALRFAGPASSDARFELAGGLFVGERQARACQLVAEAVTPAANSLVATAPARERQALATELAGAQAARAALQTELDRTRQEGMAARAELAEANARLTQAQAAATEAAAAAARQRTALEARVTAAEAAAAQAQAAAAQAANTAGQQRMALEAQAQAAEARATQAQAAMTQLRAELEQARAAQPPR